MKRLVSSDYFNEDNFPILVNFMTWENNLGHLGDKSLVGPHTHEFSELVLVSRGQVIHNCERRRQVLRAGDFLLIHPGVEHEYSHIDHNTCCWNLLYDARVPIPQLMTHNSPLFQHLYPEEHSLRNLSGQVLGRVSAEALGDVVLLLEMMARECASRSRQHRTALLTTLFSAVAVHLMRHFRGRVEGEEHWTLNKVLSAMKANCHDSNVSIDDYARAAGMSRRTLLRHFQREFHMGPLEYLQRLRISNAVALLKNSTFTNEFIAAKCGFNTYGNMWNVFRHYLDCSPSQLRQNPPAE